jgi:hypothetical protein
MKRRGVAFNCQMPASLRDAVRAAAEKHQKVVGGQRNMNRVIVVALVAHLGDQVSPSTQRDVDQFLS